jgi:hypothetical protein
MLIEFLLEKVLRKVDHSHYVCRIHHIYIDLASVTEADSSDPVIPMDSISLFLLVSALYPTLTSRVFWTYMPLPKAIEKLPMDINLDPLPKFLAEDNARYVASSVMALPVIGRQRLALR